MSAKLFPASVVGSMPRSAFVRELLMDESLDAMTRQARLDAAVRYVVAMQEHAGLDVITDGEWRRKSYVGVIADLAQGFELSTNPADGRPWTIVTGPVTPKDPGFVAREIGFVRRLTDRRIKATLPAPALLGARLWDAAASARAYPDRRDFVRACVPILRRELELVRDAGADIVQIDDPHLCLFVDAGVREAHDDWVAEADFAVEMTNAVVEGVDGVELAVHLCRRAGARARGEASFEGGYGAILDHLNRLRVHHLTMEFTDPGAGELGVLARLRPDLHIGLGCVSVTPGRIDPVDAITARARQALEHVAPERITLNPDCGFAPGSGARVDLDEVFTKLRNEVAAARALRE